MQKNTAKRAIALVLMFMLLFVFSTTAMAAVTGCYARGNNYGGYTNVYTNGKAAKLRICTFNQAGKRTSGKITVKAVSDNGAIYTWNVTGCNGWNNSSTNVTLPKGYKHYKVYIRRTNASNSNLNNCFYWSIDCMGNCWF